MDRIDLGFTVVRWLLVVLSAVSGLIKLVGIRMEFMRIMQVGFEEWQIYVFGTFQIFAALLFAFIRTRKMGAIVYSLVYAYATWYYFAFNLHPKPIPVLLTLLPIVITFFPLRHRSP